MASLRLVICFVFAALMLAAAPTASAIVDGKPDEAHDYVVFVGQQIAIPGGPTVNTGACSGVLVAPTVVVTAAHCSFTPPGAPTQFVRYAVRTGENARFTPEREVFGSIVTHPGFCFGGTCPSGAGGGFTNNDLAVVLLSEPLPGPYANLPKEDWAGKHFDKTKQLFAVGYGVVDPAVPTSFGTRNWTQAEAVVAPGAPNFLYLPVPSKAKYGTACRADSGGAALVGNTLVGVHSIGDTSCAGPSFATRTDTADARAFLSRFVELR